MYVTLNPARAGLTEDLKDYRFCGDADAVSGRAIARKGLATVSGTLDGPSGREEVARPDRQLHCEQGQETASRRGFSAEGVRQVLEEGGDARRSLGGAVHGPRSAIGIHTALGGPKTD